MYGLTRPLGNTKLANNDPFAELARDFFGFAPLTAARQTRLPLHQNPQFDFLDTPESYQLRGDLPGVSEADLEITVHEGILTVKGTRAEESLDESSSYVVRERRYGEFTRRLKLPKNADADQVAAKLENGVLTVSIPKKQELQARKIKIA